ncbi:hypothetical protein [Pseudonocardia spinosispora]|nr:hypothetical protein [Pseudonocardia spinosispora]
MAADYAALPADPVFSSIFNVSASARSTRFRGVAGVLDDLA